ncbi:MAG: helix-turn-helix transcriptional regulator [Candidatus Binatia bacterium]|nr:helix-turn-helix transcriptional regulator [Candidatus Binatia bacterium]
MPGPQEVLQDVLGCKWTIEVLRAVLRGERRPGQIQRAIPGLTTKVMNERLRKLVRYGILERKVFAEVPPRVEYWLTPRGRSLLPLLKQLDRITARWNDEIQAAQRRD